MTDVKITDHDATYMRVATSPDIATEIRDAFSFLVPGYQFMPTYKNKMWDGRINLFSPFRPFLYHGLRAPLTSFLKNKNYQFVDEVPERGDAEPAVSAFFDQLVVSSQGSTIKVRDYQRSAALHGVMASRSLLVSPTGSGKSLILYLMVRWHLAQGRKVLLIVPTIQLVSQMYTDFEDYASQDAWNVESHVAMISGGKDKDPNKPLVISTWQSISKLSEKHFQQFDVVCVDECHLATAKSLTGILERCTRAYFRHGTTGTLTGAKTHQMVLEGLLGPVHQVTTTKSLMDANQLAQLDITCLILEYSKEDRKAMKSFTYQQELDWIVTNPKRNKFIRNLALKQTGNTLILYQYVEKHGQVLYDLIREAADASRKVFFVHGGVEAEDREAIRAVTEREHNAIIIASSGTMSTGTNIRNLHNIIFASPSKSKIRNLQSIGRGLRKGSAKTTCRLFDIGDNLTHGKKQNHTFQHLTERIKIFNAEQFDYKIITINFS